MSGERLYMMPNPQSTDHKPPMAPQRGPTPLLHALTGVSAVLGLVSVAALAFKILSNVAWGGYDDGSRSGPRLTLTPFGTPERDESLMYVREVARFRNYSDSLIWAAVIVGVVLAPVTAYCSWRVTKKGPYFYDRGTRIVTYAMYHLYWIYPLIAFIVLTAMHAQSAHLPATAPPRDEAEGGLYLPQGVFDLETLACEARNLAEKAGQMSAADHLGRVCVGEMATRWLMLPIALLTAGLAIILELDRRGARRCIAVAENVRSAW